MKQKLNKYKVHLLVVLSTIFALVMNVLAIALPLNNRSTQEISDSFQVFFVPAGYVFSIWSVIYTGLIAFTIYQITKGRHNEILRKIRIPVILSSIFNGVWIIFWHYGLLELATLTMLLLLLTLIYIYSKLPYWKSKMGKLFRASVALTFSLYLGWISVATIANITVQLYALGWNGLGLGGEYWAALLCLVAADLAINLLWIRRDYPYALVIIWAVFGIYVKFTNTPALAVTAIVAVGLTGLTTLFFLYKELISAIKKSIAKRSEEKDKNEIIIIQGQNTEVSKDLVTNTSVITSTENIVEVNDASLEKTEAESTDTKQVENVETEIKPEQTKSEA